MAKGIILDKGEFSPNWTEEQKKKFEEGLKVNKFYVMREREEKQNIPIYSEDGERVIATQVSSGFSCRMHHAFYCLLSEEEKKKYVEEPSEN